MGRKLVMLLGCVVCLSGGTVAQAQTPADVGQWGPVMSWPLVAVHTSVLATGKVIVWDGFEDGPNSERVFDPATDTLTARPYARNLFCSGFAQLADGKLFIAGGHVTINSGLRDSTLWDPQTESATRAVDLTTGRWYPTVTTLPDGRAMVFSGDSIQADDSPPGNPFSFTSSTVPEVYDPVTNSYTRLTGAAVDTPLYPFMFVLPDGRVFDAGPDRQSRIIATSGSGALSPGPVSPFDGSSAVMYAPGKVMKSGTWSDPSFATLPVTGRTAVIDMTQPSPVWRETAPMAYPRSYETITVLPDGSSMVSGGTTKSDGVDSANAVLPAELWNPQTETWTTMAAQANSRMYHSTAVLLPDGRVLVAGGGQLPGYPVINQKNAQIFSPPYLFKGPRPQITAAPSTVQAGASPFTVTTSTLSTISKVSLVRLGSMTHNFDQNQRFVPLSFTASAGVLQVDAPANTNVAPPGYYMLFVTDANGVPSVSRMVRVPAPAEDSVAPGAPGNLVAAGALGRVDLTWDAATDNASVRRYNVHRGTTAGFTPTTANRIAQPTATSYSDTGLAAGDYFYRVTAEDQAGNIGPASNEARGTAGADTTAPSVSITGPAGGANLAGVTPVSATATDDVAVAGVQFRLDGAALGAEDATAPYSVSWDTRTAANGAHTLTAVARDGSGGSTTSAAVAVTVTNTAGGPVLAFAFDEPSGTSAVDASGRGNAGTIGAATRTTAGKNGGALTFNGTSAMVTVPDSNSLDLTGAMTLEAWVRPSAQSDWRTVILKETAGNLVYSLYSSSAFGGSGVARPSSWIDAQNVGATTALPVNTWSHLATTYDRATWRLYINGTQVATRAFTTAIPTSTGALRIGGNSIWGEWFAGQVDDVRVYDRALSAADVATDRDTAVGGPAGPDTTAPTAAITAPSSGATVAGPVAVTVAAADNAGVAGVQVKVDGANLGAEDTTAPYSVAWDTTTVANGSHTLTAVARDTAGNTTTASAVTVSVVNDSTAPAVSITAPVEGATVSGSVPVNATATDDVGVTGVQFKLDGANLGTEDTAAPYTVSWDTRAASNGAHVLTAVARDAVGNLRTSNVVNVTASNDTSAPSVSVTSPADGAALSATTTVTATATDDVGVSGVQFKLDGANLGAENTSAPYSVSWDTRTATNGAHALTAVARDAAGNTKTSATVAVTVANADDVAPSVSITAPAAGASLAATTTVTATATDNVGVSGVQFKLDGANLGTEDTTAPYSVSWDTRTATNGAHTLTAVARDAAANTTTSAPVGVTVANDTTAPSVSITAPAAGASLAAATTVTATATDNVGVSGVQFRLDGANLGTEDTTAPYSVSWDTRTAANGAHTLTAVARDAAANTTTSASVGVSVANTAPPPGGPVAAYAFDEPSGTSAVDASGTGNTGTITGATRTATGKNGAALTFNGTSNMVTVPDANSLDLTGAMTLEAWVRPTVQSAFRTVLLKETTGDLVYALYSSSAFGGNGVARPSAWISAQGLGATTALPVNAWSHLATTYDRVTWRLYLNGVQVASRAFTTVIPTSTGPLRIGGNSIWAEWFAGQIDDVRVYNRALTPAEVTADRDRAVTPSAP